MQALTREQIRVAAPSVFAEQPYHAMSAKYRFFPTSHVVEALMHQDFLPVRAQQSRTRIEGKGDFTKHLLRFRHASHADSPRDSTPPATRTVAELLRVLHEHGLSRDLLERWVRFCETASTGSITFHYGAGELQRWEMRECGHV